MRFMNRKAFVILTLIIVISVVFLNESCQKDKTPNLQFKLSFPSSVHPEAITGRVFVMITKSEMKEPRLLAGSWSNSVPVAAAG